MSRKRLTAEKIIGMLRESEVALFREEDREVCRNLGFRSKATIAGVGLWRLKTTQAKRIKDLERENSRLKKAVADLTLDKLIMREALEGNY